MIWPAWWIVRGSIPRQALNRDGVAKATIDPGTTRRHYAVVMAEREPA